jgi:hypothetical protein
MTEHTEDFVIQLVRKLKFIYKAQPDDMVQIPRTMVADTIVALFEEEMTERRAAERKKADENNARIEVQSDPIKFRSYRPYLVPPVPSPGEPYRVCTTSAETPPATASFWAKFWGG